jgi:hypothetical protein
MLLAVLFLLLGILSLLVVVRVLVVAQVRSGKLLDTAQACKACRAQAVASCREAKLRDLNLGHTHLPDASPAHLEGLTGLTELNLENTEVSHPGVEGLQHFLARVKVV